MSEAEPFVQTRARFAGFGTRLLRSAIGPGFDSLTLLLVHGWGDSADSYKPLLRQLALLGIGGLAIDLPGCGEADDLRPGARVPQLIDFLRAAISQLDRRVVPVGQSLGGRVTLTALACGVDAEVPLCLAIAPAPLRLPPWQRMLVRNAALAAHVSAIGEPQPLEHRVAELVRSYRRTCFSNPTRVPAEVFADYARHYTAARMHGHIESLRQVGEEMALPVDLSGVGVPVDLAWGTHDRLAPLSGSEDYLRQLPDAHLTVMQGCGHHLHLECVAEIAELLRQRLTAGEAARPA